MTATDQRPADATTGAGAAASPALADLIVRSRSDVAPTGQPGVSREPTCLGNGTRLTPGAYFCSWTAVMEPRASVWPIRLNMRNATVADGSTSRCSVPRACTTN